MPRRPRRSGISYIRNDRKRSITFFKRRAGLLKTVSDLSTLTGARIALVLESENGIMSAFGTPLASPIIDSFLSGKALVDPFTSEAQKSTITDLQNEMFLLEKDKAMEAQRMKENITRAKQIQETSRKAKLVYGEVKDISLEDLDTLYHDLAQIHQEIKDQLRHQGQGGHRQEIGGSRDPLFCLSSSSRSQIQQPPRRFPWTPLQQSLQAPSSSRLLPKSSGSRSSLLNPTAMPPSSPHEPRMHMLQRNPMPHRPLMLQPQAHMMPQAKETRQYNYQNHGVGINNNISGQFSLSAPPPPPPPSSAPHIPLAHEFPPASLPLQRPLSSPPLEGELPFQALNPNPVLPPQNHDANTGGQDMPGPSGLHQQAYFDWLYNYLMESSPERESPGGDAPGTYLGES